MMLPAQSTPTMISANTEIIAAESRHVESDCLLSNDTVAAPNQNHDYTATPEAKNVPNIDLIPPPNS